jgi:alkylated DNA repair protein (DNA oxidative demethylase)
MTRKNETLFADELLRLRNMITPGGHPMSVATRVIAMTGLSGNFHAWPAMPKVFLHLASSTAAKAGLANLGPDVCLINRYQPGTRLSRHQDRDEHDYRQPIVSLSLGLPATFLFGGSERSPRPRRIRLASGDVAVWGEPTRLNFPRIAPLEEGFDPLLSSYRINLTFRNALQALAFIPAGKPLVPEWHSTRHRNVEIS